jgi:hypothetical protein
VRGVGVAFALALALAALPGCGDEAVPPASAPADAGPALPDGGLLDWPVGELGPFGVGYRVIETAYTAPGGAERAIHVNVWYPTLDTEGPPPAYLHVFQDADVIEGATAAPPIEPAGYPVHVYSHGNWGFGGTSSDLMHWYASHGWVAVAPDHAGDTLPEHADAQPLSVHYLRPRDVSAALDALEALPTEDPLAGKCRTDRVVLSGHSLGTVTTWAGGGAPFDLAAVQALCDEGAFSEPCEPGEVDRFLGVADPRVVAGIPMAGGVGGERDWFGEGGFDAAGKPFMLMTGSADPVGADVVWNRVHSIDLTWLEFEGGCHQLFALGGCEGFPEAEGWRLVDAYALAFGRRHVLDDPGAEVAGILDGSTVLSSKVRFMRK